MSAAPMVAGPRRAVQGAWAMLRRAVKVPGRIVRRSPARPKASIDSGRTVSSAMVHVALAVCAVGAFLTAAGTQVATGLVVSVCVLIVVTVAASVRRPGYLSLGLSLFPTVVVLVTVAPVGYSWRTPLLMLAVHATYRLCWLATQISASTRVELVALEVQGRQFVVVNLLGQAVALLAGALTVVSQADDGGPASGSGWLAVPGAVVLMVLAIVLRSGARAWPSREAPLSR